MDAHANAAYSLVATAPSPAASGATLVVTAGEGARFPAAPFNVTIWATGAQPVWVAGGATGGNFEIARCTSRTVDTLTLTRAQEGTSARTIVVGDQIAATITAKTLTDVEALNAPDYLVGTPQAVLSGEIVVGATPGGELENTWAEPHVKSSHAGSTHAAVQAAAEATAAAAAATHAALTTTAHGGFKIGQATVPSASAIAAPAGGGVVLLTGTTPVNTLTGGALNDVVTLVASGQATGVPVVLNHATGADNLALAGGRNLGIYARLPADAAASVGESVTFIKTATYWQELTRALRVVLDYQERTSLLTVIQTTEAAAQAAVTSSAITFDGATPITYEFSCYDWSRGTSTIYLIFWEDAASLGLGTVTVNTFHNMTRPLRRTPTAAEHTVSARFFVNAGTGYVEGGAGGVGAQLPMSLTVSRGV